MIALLGDIEVGYDDSGTGTPVLFVHGFPHDRTLWASQVHGLAGQARCIAPDLRGFGESTPSPPFGMDRYADDLASLLDLLRVDRAVIAGLSMGGYVAFAFWRRHRRRVRALILANTRAGADTDEARDRRRRLVGLALEHGSSAVAEAMLPGMLGKTSRRKGPELANAVHRMISAAPVAGVVGALEAMMDRLDSTATLATIDVPALVVAGEEDTLIPAEESRAMHNAIRGSTLEVIHGAGHLSNLERPAAFNHVVSEFLARMVLA